MRMPKMFYNQGSLYYPRLRSKNDRLKRDEVLVRNMARADKGDNRNE